jgi:hypothetical protein
MLKKTIKFIDYAGNEKEADFRFHLTAPEFVRFEVQFPEGLEKGIKKLAEENNARRVMEFFEDLILTAYGVLTPDQTAFVKSEEEKTLFSQSAAYEALFIELMSDEEQAIEFFKAIAPKQRMVIEEKADVSRS